MGYVIKIDPNDILQAFSQAKVLVSMRDAELKKLVTGENLTIIGDQHDGPAELQKRYLEALVLMVSEHGEDIIIEWVVWPEISIAEHSVNRSVISQFKAYPNPNPERAKHERDPASLH